MSINLGSNSFGLYLGSSKIAEAYIGSTKVYSSGKEGLPAKTIRFKFNNENYIPTTDASISGTSKVGTWTRVSSSPNIWDWYYDSDSWAGSSTTEGIFKLNYKSFNNSYCSIIDANLLGVTDISYIFCPTSYNGTNYNCDGLDSIDKFNNTNSITSLRNSFRECSSLKNIPLFNTSSVTNMKSTFYKCSISSIPLFDTSNVTDMNFTFCYCTYLSSVPLLNTSNVTSMYQMFYGCESLLNPPLFDTSKVTDMHEMFYNAMYLQSIPLFNTSSVKDMGYMFYNCRNVKSGALALYQQASTQAKPPSSHTSTFKDCGSNTSSGSAELAQIPSSWGGDGA